MAEAADNAPFVAASQTDSVSDANSAWIYSRIRLSGSDRIYQRYSGLRDSRILGYVTASAVERTPECRPQGLLSGVAN